MKQFKQLRKLQEECKKEFGTVYDLGIFNSKMKIVMIITANEII